MARRSHDHRSGHGGRHRARRGALRAAVLTLLDERPMHGYELITELEARSGGRWRPSPGAIYPALNRLADAGLLTSSDDDGTRRFALTDQGRQALAEMRDTRPDDAPAPWDDTGTGQRGDLRRQVAELVSQARQIGRFGTPDQIERARTVFADATRRLYEILATPDTDIDAGTEIDDGRATGGGDPDGTPDGTPTDDDVR